MVKGRVLARNIGTSMYASERGRTVGTGAFQTESLPQPDPALQPCSVLPRGPCNADRPFLDGRAICRRAQRLACRYTCAMRGVHGSQRSMHREMPPRSGESYGGTHAYGYRYRCCRLCVVADHWMRPAHRQTRARIGGSQDGLTLANPFRKQSFPMASLLFLNHTRRAKVKDQSLPQPRGWSIPPRRTRIHPAPPTP